MDGAKSNHRKGEMGSTVSIWLESDSAVIPLSGFFIATIRIARKPTPYPYCILLEIKLKSVSPPSYLFNF